MDQHKEGSNMSYRIVALRGDNPSHAELFREFYDDFLMPSFGEIPDHMDSYEDLVQGISTLDDPELRLYINVMLDESNSIMGGTVNELYLRCDCGLIGYVVVGEKYRGKGVGHILIENAVQAIDEAMFHLTNGAKKHADAVFLETYRCSGDVVENKVVERRMRLFGQMGFKLVDLDYVQPSLGPGKDSADDLLLLVRLPPPPEQDLEAPGDGKTTGTLSSSMPIMAPASMPPNIVRNFLVAYSDSCSGGAPGESFNTLMKSMAAAMGGGSDHLALMDPASKEAMEKYLTKDDDE